jgi:2-dehydro-3-deoxyphosphooctonate aldolase (KDO 8-P synthase)
MLTEPANLWTALSDAKGLFLIAGPCVVEDDAICLEIARGLIEVCARLGLPFVFKASYDKANRSSSQSFRGPGMAAGLRMLAKVRNECAVPVLTDIHTEEQAKAAAEVVDILQIPALLCRQTDLIEAAVRTGKIVNLKKGQFLSPDDMRQVVKKAEGAGGRQLLVTERGTTFGYNNLVSDMRAIPIMKKFGFPVVFDATHSVQLPGAGGDRSGGQGEFAPVLARAAVAAGADGVFIETHPDPSRALSDGPNMVSLAEMPRLLEVLVRLKRAVQADGEENRKLSGVSRAGTEMPATPALA